MQYRIKKSSIKGNVKVSGAKNSALRLIVASILTDEEVILKEFPSNILDGKVQIQMLREIGKCVDVKSEEIKITKCLNTNVLKWEGRSIRNTLLMLAVLLGKTGYGKVPLPGGCNIGNRHFDLHELIFSSFGAHVWIEGNYLCATSRKRIKGTNINLPIRSTGATENAILCGVLAEGITRIYNPHIRPEILDLIQMLNKMGACIEVFGQERIDIVGCDELKGVEHEVIPDNLEALTWLIGAAVTGGDIEIENFPKDHLEVPLIFLRESGCKFYVRNDSIITRGSTPYPVEISTGPYPGINSDMQPLFAVYGACANGSSKIIDLRFPGRYAYAEELAKMGMNYQIKGDLLQINRTTKLTGAEVNAVDLRAGVALALAACVAEGETKINNAWQIERGYNNFFEKFKNLNGQIEIINN